LTGKVLAGPQLEAPHCVLVILILAELEQEGNPPETAFDGYEFESGEAIQQPAEDRVGDAAADQATPRLLKNFSSGPKRSKVLTTIDWSMSKTVFPGPTPSVFMHSGMHSA